MPSRLAGFVCPTVSMVTTGHATGVEKTLIESTSLCCRSYSVLHVRDQKNEWSVFVE